jgi:hypothetical protein
MMDYKTKLRALIALNAALVLALIIGALTAPERRSSSVMKISLASGLEGVSGIGISAPGFELTLQKRADSWLVADAEGSLPADSSRVDGLINALTAIASAERVAKNRASWTDLGLGEDRVSRLRLTDFSGKTRLELLVGDYTPSGSSAYAAFSDGQEAWALPAGAAAYVKASMNSWLDLRVFPTALSAQDIQQIRVRGGLELEDGGERRLDYTLRRSGAAWQFEGQALDPLRVDAMARSLVSLRAAQYAAGGDTLGAGAERIWAELALGNGEVLRLALGARGGDGRYLATSSGRERGFYLPGWAAEEAFKPLSALVPAP